MCYQFPVAWWFTEKSSEENPVSSFWLFSLIDRSDLLQYGFCQLALSFSL